MRKSIILAVVVVLVLGLSFAASANELRVSYNVPSQTITLGGLAALSPSFYLTGDVTFITPITIFELAAYYAVLNNPGMRIGIGGGFVFLPGPSTGWSIGADAMIDIGSGLFLAGSAALYEASWLFGEAGIGYSFGSFFAKLSYTYHKPLGPLPGVVITAGLYL